jgi:predicted AlkP superfamily pyrophosphatase or phosphodiesterase
MIRVLALVLLACAVAYGTEQPARRVVILKIDGLNADLLYRNMREKDSATGKPRLPWFAHIFGENGTVFENFYTRGISLSAPSWSMLETGQHTVIRGNAEYDRYTGEIYDYLNFVPFYLGYAQGREVDMPGTEVLDAAGIPLSIDAFGYTHTHESFQLFQRGVYWPTLKHALRKHFSKSDMLATLEHAGAPSFEEALDDETASDLTSVLQQPRILYLDFFTGSLDHAAHATNDPAALYQVLRRLDTLAGRIWTAIQNSPMADLTIFVVVSDHGMNNVPGITSQTFSLPDLFNSAAGGAHHVMTNRYQLSDYKLKGLDPLVHRVITPSTASIYLSGEASRYPTAWLDIDGNERTAVHLRDSDLNKIHILLIELAKPELQPLVRQAAAGYLRQTIDSHRAVWSKTANELDEELAQLKQAIEVRRKIVAEQPKKWTPEQIAAGDDKAGRRLRDQLHAWEREYTSYSVYVSHVRGLLALNPDPSHQLRTKIQDLVPELSAGNNNTIRDLQHYIVGPSPDGLALDAAGHLDPERSFRYVDNFELLASQRVRNNPQPALSSRPIDFIASSLPDTDSNHAYWLYGDEDHQLVILTDPEGNIAVRPVAHLHQDQEGKVRWSEQSWAPGFPLHLFEDSELQLPDRVEEGHAGAAAGSDRGTWLSAWHTEHEWMHAVHGCAYSNAMIGITEELSPVAANVPGPRGVDSILLRFERRRRELVQPDFHVFASDHWNFNSRFPNPGGNHGSFFRISTHSVWMLSGAGIPARVVTEPYDSLNLGSTVLSLTGQKPPMPDRAVTLIEQNSGSVAHAQDNRIVQPQRRELNEPDTLKDPNAAGTRLVLRGDTK